MKMTDKEYDSWEFQVIHMEWEASVEFKEEKMEYENYQQLKLLEFESFLEEWRKSNEFQLEWENFLFELALFDETSDEYHRVRLIRPNPDWGISPTDDEIYEGTGQTRIWWLNSENDDNRKRRIMDDVDVRDFFELYYYFINYSTERHYFQDVMKKDEFDKWLLKQGLKNELTKLGMLYFQDYSVWTSQAFNFFNHYWEVYERGRKLKKIMEKL